MINSALLLASSEAITHQRRKVDRLQRFWLSLAIITGLIIVMVAAGLLGLGQ